MSKESDQYRFSGYRMPMVQLDSTGLNYIQIPVMIFPRENQGHQPAYFRKPYYHADIHMGVVERRRAMHGRLYPLSG
jgi:hypothetical protein